MVKSKKSVALITIAVLCLCALSYYIWVFCVNRNFDEVVKGRIYRSGQPRTEQLRSWIDQYHIKTIINLRGNESPHSAEEAKLANELNVRIVFIKLGAYKLITTDKLSELISILKTAPQPMLIHCGSGIDRAGTVSTLAAWIAGGQNFKTAQRHMYVPPGPWKRRWFVSSHISDTLKKYESYCDSNKLDSNSLEQFEKWNTSVYKNFHIDRKSDMR